jgi:outer membrane protein assembly factor BamB
MLFHRTTRRHLLFSVITVGMVIGSLLSACGATSVSPGATSLASPTAPASAFYIFEATVAQTASNTMYALNPQTGVQVWQAPITGIPVVAVVSGSTLVVSSGIPARDPSQVVDHVSGLDIQTGKRLWQRDTKGAAYIELFQSQGKLYGLFISLDRTQPNLYSLVNLNPADGSPIWQKRLTVPGTSRTAIPAGDMLYVVSADTMQHVTTVHLTDGSLGKRIDIPVNLSADSGPTPLYANGAVYYDLQDSLTTFRIIALHANDATQIWKKTFDRDASVLTASPNAVLVAEAPDPNSKQSDPQGSLVALSPADGAQIWQEQNYSLGVEDVATEAERIFVISDPTGVAVRSPSIRALNARTGAVLWNHALDPSQQPVRIHVLAGMVYVELTPVGDATSHSDRLLALRASDGALMWKSNRELGLLADGVFQ